MNWQNRLTIIVFHLTLWWGVLIFLGLLTSLTAVMLKLTYNFLTE
jgi:hypothetical protein